MVNKPRVPSVEHFRGDLFLRLSPQDAVRLAQGLLQGVNDRTQYTTEIYSHDKEELVRLRVIIYDNRE